MCELLFQLILVLTAFVLLLFVTLSAPYIHSIALYRLLVALDQAGSKVTGDLNLGVFGFCASAITIETPIGDSNELSTSSCSTPRLGYTIDLDPAVSQLLRRGITEVISKTTQILFVLSPIATGLTLIYFFLSYYLRRLQRTHSKHDGTPRLMKLFNFTLISGIAAGMVASASFIANYLIGNSAGKGLREIDDGLSLLHGNAIWMTVAAAALVLITTFETYLRKRKYRLPGSVQEQTY